MSIVASNYGVKNQLNSLLAAINAGTGIRLFQNVFSVGPATLITDFVECSFTSYTRQNPSGKFGITIKIVDGVYASQSSTFSFPVGVGPAQQVAGWLIADSSNWILSSLFPDPLSAANPNPVQFSISLILQSLSVACS